MFSRLRGMLRVLARYPPRPSVIPLTRQFGDATVPEVVRPFTSS